MTKHWDDLPFWESGEWQVIQERLDDLDKAKKVYCPKRENLFAALDATPLEEVKVMIVGQDPYPHPAHATGVAFDVPHTLVKPYPPTLQNILEEYRTDLGFPEPTTGCLTPWTIKGVLLWNATPSCLAHKPGSHSNWIEWSLLTRQIIEELSKKGRVFAFLGSKAGEFSQFVNEETNVIIKTSHPSPRGNINSRVPFLGSRLFSTINVKLVEEGLGKIDWKLP